MGPNIRKLLEIGGPALAGNPSSPGEDFGSLPLATELWELLSHRNGFLAFESALVVRPSSATFQDGTPTTPVEAWNEPQLWTGRYEDLTDGCLFFAQDVFGGQFALTSRGVVSFDPETGETEHIGASLEEWAGELLRDYETMTGFPLAREWQRLHGRLPPRHILAPKRPFVLGGEYTLENLYLADEVRSLEARAAVALQIRDLPDGATITLEVVD